MHILNREYSIMPRKEMNNNNLRGESSLGFYKIPFAKSNLGKCVCRSGPFELGKTTKGSGHFISQLISSYKIKMINRKANFMLNLRNFSFINSAASYFVIPVEINFSSQNTK